jgi:hypothetical protein
LFFSLTFIIGFIFTFSSDEGMWMLHLLKQHKLSEMHELGLTLEDFLQPQRIQQVVIPVVR